MINVPIADLRREPIQAKRGIIKDPLQESQLLYGEKIKIIRETNEWFFIEAIEQQRFTKDKGWVGYPGWVQKSQVIENNYVMDLSNSITISKAWTHIRSEPLPHAPSLLTVSMGTRLEVMEQLPNWFIVRLPDQKTGAIPHTSANLSTGLLNTTGRMNILRKGEELLNHPYQWGGRSNYRDDWKDQLSSCDCSGLINLLYRIEGIDLPRDAHDQFLVCKKVDFKELQISDLIFLASTKNPERMSHVMLYAGNDELLDANITDYKIVKTSSQQRFGKPLSQMKTGEILGGFQFFFGTVKTDPSNTSDIAMSAFVDKGK